MSSAKVITGILAGIIVGLLIAPAKGSETRKKLSKTVNDLSDYFQEENWFCLLYSCRQSLEDQPQFCGH